MSTWSPDLLREYREEFISPRCATCTEQCCVFGERFAGNKIFVLPLKEREAQRLVDVAGEKHWPASWAARRGAEASIDEDRRITQGPCPAFIAGSCALYHDADRPDGCAKWPVFDRREFARDQSAMVEGYQVCPVLDPGHVKDWLEQRTGLRFDLRWPDPPVGWTLSTFQPGES